MNFDRVGQVFAWPSANMIFLVVRSNDHCDDFVTHDVLSLATARLYPSRFDPGNVVTLYEPRDTLVWETTLTRLA